MKESVKKQDSHENFRQNSLFFSVSFGLDKIFFFFFFEQLGWIRF
jgi:hypothetical protein